MHYNSLKNGIEEKGNTESEVINTVNLGIESLEGVSQVCIVNLTVIIHFRNKPLVLIFPSWSVIVFLL